MLYSQIGSWALHGILNDPHHDFFIVLRHRRAPPPGPPGPAHALAAAAAAGGGARADRNEMEPPSPFPGLEPKP